jgi:hypothetical protein
MIDRIDTHPTRTDDKYVEKRNGKDRRKVNTTLDPDVDRRKGSRRKHKKK